MSMLSFMHSRCIYERRSDIMATCVAARIDSGSTILDIGCGDGQITKLIASKVAGSSVSGIDVLVRPGACINVVKYDGRNIPLPDNSVDTCLLIDSLHHTDNPLQLLKEAGRVCRHGIIIKDHLADGFFSHYTLRFMDWVGNRHHGVALPYNYLSKVQWNEHFNTLQWRLEYWNTNLHIYPVWCSWLFDRQLHFIAQLTIPEEFQPAADNMIDTGKMNHWNYFSLPSHSWPARIRSRLSWLARKSMYNLFIQAIKPAEHETIVDIGVTPHTQYPENNFLERLYPYPRKITAVSIEDASNIEAEFPGVTFIKIQPGPLPFKDKEFDVLFCSAVLEHVGSREDQTAFIKELLRVSRRFFITTPNRWYPVDFHTMLPFLHWLPQKIHQGILRRFGYSFLAKTENLNLCGAADIRKLFPAGHDFAIQYKWFLGMPSNIIIHNRIETSPPPFTSKDIYLRFLFISGCLGITSIALIEFIGWLSPALFERFYFLIFSSVYLLGTAVNFIMQSVHIIQREVAPKLYGLYLPFNLFMAILCGGISSFFYGYLLMDFHHIIGIKSASCIAAVLMMSPLTCYGVVKILGHRKPNVN